MPAGAMPDHVTSLLAKPNPAVMATVRPDGQPVTVATWYLMDGGRVLLNLDARRKRLAHLRDDPRVSLTVLDADGWYSHVSMQGRVGEILDDIGLADIDRISRHYTGNPYRDRERPRVSVWVDVDTWHTWGPAAAG